MREIFGDLIKNIEVNLKLKRWSNPKNKFKITQSFDFLAVAN